MADVKAPTRKLVLGWQVTKGMDPRYWLQAGAAPGKQKKEDLVTVAAEEIARHAVIIAQSGSGKSFFLGRLIEEILLETKCNVLVLDPNADFREIHRPVDEKFWGEKASYSSETRKGYLPDEASQQEFMKRWDTPIKKRIYTRKGGGGGDIQTLYVNWFSLSVDWLFGEVDTALRAELRHCHEFAKLVTMLRQPPGTEPSGLGMDDLEFVKELAEKTRSTTWNDIAATIRTRLGPPLPSQTGKSEEGFDREKRRTTTIERAAIHKSFVTKETDSLYFSVAYDNRESRLFTFVAPRSEPPSDRRVRVIDLPSIDDPDQRMMTVSFVLAREWQAARDRWEDALQRDADKDSRVPTFVVVDEAHNFVFAEARGAAQFRLQEQFRRIAAEGRKFGLFLVLVSQRPDKLDRLVLSEMENQAIMKLNSNVVLRHTRKLLGLSKQNASMAARCLEYDAGRVLLIGPWAGKEPTPLYVALRRTKEGGRNLREESWTIPE
jgi:hypothetical protein